MSTVTIGALRLRLRAQAADLSFWGLCGAGVRAVQSRFRAGFVFRPLRSRGFHSKVRRRCGRVGFVLAVILGFL